VVRSGWMFTLKVKYKVGKMNETACIGRRFYIAWKVNSFLLFADDCWCGCNLWRYYTDIEVGWLGVVITVVSIIKI
jgi:hypothetical protein